MELNKVKPGLHVKIIKLGETKGMLVRPKHLQARKKGATGITHGYVPGHGGDVWWIEHDDDKKIGAYSYTEFEISNDEVVKALRKEVRRLKKKLKEKNELIKVCHKELDVFRGKI